MSSFLPTELTRHLHSAVALPDQWKVARYEVALDVETSLPSYIVLELQSLTGVVKRLKFDLPEMADYGPLQIPQISSVYVASTRSLGWEGSRSVEVGEWLEERSILFWAARVTEIA